MRMLLKATMDNQKASDAIQAGTMGDALRGMMEELEPEATYFYPEDGRRTAIFVFDMQDPSQLPALTEPFFQTAGADVRVSPVMDANDLRSGLQAVQGG
jgi:hypothetical protein